MEKEQTLNRRQFLGAAAGTAAAVAAAGPLASKAFSSDGPTVGKNALITPRTLSVQQFSIRDATGRLGVTNNPTPTMGFLGGPDFPDDPTDLGPLVPLPGGFQEVFEYLASIDYAGIEFFSFNQNAGTLGGGSRRSRRSAGIWTPPGSRRTERTRAASAPCTTRRPEACPRTV